jgi:hypothetical protein
MRFPQTSGAEPEVIRVGRRLHQPAGSIFPIHSARFASDGTEP